MTEQELFDRYRSRGVVRGNELCLSLPVAFEFVSDCQANNLSILGIEVFHQIDGGIMPRMDLIADYSPGRLSSNFESNWVKYRDICHTDAINFLQNHVPTDDDILITFVIWSESEFSESMSNR